LDCVSVGSRARKRKMLQITTVARVHSILHDIRLQLPLNRRVRTCRVRVKVKLFKQQVVKTFGAVEVQSHTFLTLTLLGG